MRSSFIAYIDESGDEGFSFKSPGCGSTRWFVLSAVVFHRSHEQDGVAALRRVRERLGHRSDQPFHLCEMGHLSRLVLFHELRAVRFRIVSVLCHKPDLPDIEVLQQHKFMLYRRMSCVLVERLSWLGRDHVGLDGEDGTVEIVFSTRMAMSYDDVRNDVRELRRRSADDLSLAVHWPSIRLDRIRAIQHHQMAGLQIADAVASGTFYAVNTNRHGIADPGYLRLLRSHVYRLDDRWLGAGLTFMSDLGGTEKKNAALGCGIRMLVTAPSCEGPTSFGVPWTTDFG